MAALAGCANESGEQEASAVARGFLEAAGQGDTATACGLLAPKTQQDLEASDGTPCPSSLPVDRLQGAVQTVSVWSDRAQVSTGDTAMVWSDCRFRSGCPRNDIVMSKSTSETTTSTVEHFVPGIGVDRTTSGATARIGLTYYFYSNSNCTAATSQGRMFGDYISTSVRPGANAFPVLALATAPTGSTFNHAMFIPTNGLPI